MASIHRHSSGRSRFWYASFLGDDGRWKLRSTKQTNREKAKHLAAEWEYVGSLARDATLTEAQCRRILSDMLERTTGDSIRQVTTSAHFKEWLASKEAKKSALTVQRYANVLHLFERHVGAKAGKALGAVTTREVQSFLDARLKNGAASKTVSVDRKALSSAFNSALRQGLILHNPVLAAEIPKVVSSEREVFTTAAVGILLATLKKLEAGESFTLRQPDAKEQSFRLAPEHARDWHTAVLLGYCTGARLRDCVSMRWDCVDLQGETIAYDQSKTGARVQIPMSKELSEHLSARASTDDGEPCLCPTLYDRDSGGAHGLSQTFKVVMRCAGLNPGTEKGMGSRQFSPLSFHSLRHSFNSALANAGVSQELRMKLTGHKSREINRRYTHHELAPLKRAIEMLPSVSTL